MKFILFVYLSTFSTHSGISVTSAEFNSKETCEEAALEIKKDFKSMFVQEPQTICVEK